MQHSSLGFLVFLGITITAAQGACNLSCGANASSCYAVSRDTFDCLRSIPLNKTWASATLDVLTQSLQNFGFRALYHKTGPPYSISLDVVGALEAARELLNAGEFSADFDFQEHVQAIITGTLDAHTRYKKPLCYNATFVQPIVFNLELDEAAIAGSSLAAQEPIASLEPSVFAAQYAAFVPSVDLNALLGKQVVAQSAPPQGSELLARSLASIGTCQWG